jgi:hypothetical protein
VRVGGWGGSQGVTGVRVRRSGRLGSPRILPFLRALARAVPPPGPSPYRQPRATALARPHPPAGAAGRRLPQAPGVPGLSWAPACPPVWQPPGRPGRLPLRGGPVSGRDPPRASPTEHTKPAAPPQIVTAAIPWPSPIKPSPIKPSPIKPSPIKEGRLRRACGVVRLRRSAAICVVGSGRCSEYMTVC